MSPPLRPALLLRIFVPFALGYLLSYLFRVVNAVIAPELSAELGLDASDLGLLSSAYFLAFAAFQLPLGILLDRYGPRRTEAVLLLFAAAGALIFARAEETAGLIAGRALIGFGVSACLMAAFKAFVQWFPAERLAQECRYLVKDFGTSQSPKSTRQRDSRYCPDRPALITTPSRTLQQSCSCATPS